MGSPVKARKRKSGNTPEGQAKRAIRDFLNLYGVWHYVQVQGPLSARGVSDLVGIYKGRPLYIEVKAPGKRIKPGSEQERFLENVHERGGIAIEADGVESLVKGFERYGYKFNVLF